MTSAGLNFRALAKPFLATDKFQSLQKFLPICDSEVNVEDKSILL